MEDKPLVSFCLFTYNQEQFIRDALEGIASQDYPNMEIIISDDNSCDNTRIIIEEFRCKYNGTHKIRYNFNSENLGLVRHFNKVMSMVNGDYVVLAAGDDVSLKNRTAVSVQQIIEAKVYSLALNFKYIDGKGNDMHKYAFTLANKMEKFFLSDYIAGRIMKPSGPSRIFAKGVFDFFGPFQDDCPTEDTTLTFRALLLGGVAHYDEVGVFYRWHGNNMSTPDNLYKNINSDKIFYQYYKDLCVAKEKKLIKRTDYKLVKKIIKDYKITQSLIRKLYITKNRYFRHILCLLYVLNPRVLHIHKNMNFLRQHCNDLFIFSDKISSIIK